MNIIQQPKIADEITHSVVFACMQFTLWLSLFLFLSPSFTLLFIFVYFTIFIWYIRSFVCFSAVDVYIFGLGHALSKKIQSVELWRSCSMYSSNVRMVVHVYAYTIFGPLLFLCSYFPDSSLIYSYTYSLAIRCDFYVWAFCFFFPSFFYCLI